MSYHPSSPSHPHAVADGIAYSHFDVASEPAHKQLLAWRERVGHVIDIVPLREQLVQPFRGAITRFDAGEFAFTDCITDQVRLERSIARISRDNVRSFVFHVFLTGGAEPLVARSAKLASPSSMGGILALDMDQPVQMLRHACRVITFFVPGAVLQDLLVDPATIHCRVIGPENPIARLIIERAAALAGRIRHMSAIDARHALHAIVQLLGEAYGRQAGLLGNARAAERAVVLDRVLRHIRNNLHDADLSPERVLDALGLPRPTVYRMFQHEGGIASYIRKIRLRSAANELVQFPQIPVKDIAYASGFKTASDFTRAFRRAYDMAPQDLRMVKV